MDKLQAAGDLDAAVAMLENGFDVRKGDWLKYQSPQIMVLSDEELDGVAGGKEGGSEYCGTGRGIQC